MAEFKYEINDKVALLSETGDYTCEVNGYGDVYR